MSQYAILVAITSYPGLSDLEGPEHDADNFRDWLISADGGNLPQENVIQIRSSDYPPIPAPDRFSAHPAEIDFKKALIKLLYEEDGTTLKENAGKRIYLYFAGHGFSGKRLSEAALYTATAAKNDPEHIPGKRYAESIVRTNTFGEVVLIMDCCRDVDLSDAIEDPKLKLPDRGGLAANVKLMEAYAAGRGQQARERPDSTSGKVRGLFTTAFVEALREAGGDENGNVTAAKIKHYINDRWPAYFSGDPGYSVDIVLPSGPDDIIFAQRCSKPNVLIRFSEPQPSNGASLTVQDSSHQVIFQSPCNTSGIPVSLSEGFYKVSLSEPARSTFIDVNSQTSEVFV